MRKLMNQASAQSRKPTVFIASSKEARKVARAIGVVLNDVAEPRVWDHGVFHIAEHASESLSKMVRSADFAVIVLHADDVLVSRGEVLHSTRDNVLFEMGLAAGRLGPSRCFVLAPEGLPVKIPSDLAGVTIAFYPLHSERSRLVAGMNLACDEIRDRIESLGRFLGGDPFDHIGAPAGDPATAEVLGGAWVSRYTFRLPKGTGVQYNIELLSPSTERLIIGQSLISRSSTEPAFAHQLLLWRLGTHVFGSWLNSNTDNVGVMQFRLDNRPWIMEGQHLGNGSTSVESGEWKWIKLKDVPSTFVATSSAWGLHPIGDLDAVFLPAHSARTTLSLEDVARPLESR